VYAAALDRQIPVGARVLEIGCGTGQLGAFLSIGGRSVVRRGHDAGVARARGRLQATSRPAQLQLPHKDLFDLPLRAGPFDFVIAKGVLMATRDAQAAFHVICPFVRPGGYVIVGLYNRYRRIPTTLRRLYLQLTKTDPRKVDYVMPRHRSASANPSSRRRACSPPRSWVAARAPARPADLDLHHHARARCSM
jgi:SAM-dependent methyltransferase